MLRFVSLFTCFTSHLGHAIDAVGGYIASITRGMLSICVPIDDLGKIFAFISTLDGLTPIILSQIYASIWKVINVNRTLMARNRKLNI